MIIDCSEKKAAQLSYPEWKLKRESLNGFIGTLIRNTLRLAVISKNIDTSISAFQLLSDDSIFDAIIDCSEKKAAQLSYPEWKLKRESLNGFIGRLHARDQTSSKCAFKKLADHFE